MGNLVRNPDMRIMEVIQRLAGHYGRTWCYPSQAKLCVLLGRFTGRVMSRRTLNRHLNALEGQGYLRRIRRHYRDKVRGFTMRSTVYEPALRWRARSGRLVRGVLQAARWAAASPGGSHVTLAAQYLQDSIKSLIQPPPKAALSG